MELSEKRERCQGCEAQGLPLTKAKRKACFFSVRLHRAACLAASVGLGAKPHKKKMFMSCLFFRIWGGTTTPPHIDVFRRFY